MIASIYCDHTLSLTVYNSSKQKAALVPNNSEKIITVYQNILFTETRPIAF